MSPLHRLPRCIVGLASALLILSIMVACDDGDSSSPEAVEAPVFSPAAGSYQSPIVVTIAGPQGSSVYYTTDGSDPDSGALAYVNPVQLGAGSHLLKAIAYVGDESSEIVSAEYTIGASSSLSLTIHAKAPEGWSTPLWLHYWDTSPSVDPSVWPGVEMQDEGFGWWRYSIEGVESAKLVVHDNSGNQSEDLDRAGEGWYADGQWYDHNPDGLVVHFFKPEGWSETVLIHYWDTVPDVGETAWPGEAMVAEGEGWYSYVIAGASSASMVFNDGAGQQSGDLSRGREGWYQDETWYDTKPSETQAPLVPVITATPSAGTYAVAQSVVLSGSNSDDVIFYTTDGSTPSPSSAQYSAPIEVSEDTTIQAMGVNRDNVQGEMASFVYVIDENIEDLPPVAVLEISPSRIPENSATQVSLKASASSDPEGAGLEIRWDLYGDGSWSDWLPIAQDGERSQSYQLSAGIVIKIEVRDPAGQVASASKALAVGDLEPLGDFREETIYFLLTARWNNGDTSNDYYNRDRYKEGDPQWRGDFAGLIERLDYIQDLGFTAIWITPPIENRSGLDYHGYHGYDWYTIDPRLESPGATYQDLIDAAHARGIKIIQDVVVNHSSQYGIRGQVWIDHLPIKYYVEEGSQQGDIDLGPYQGNLGDYRSPYREDNDNPVAPEWFRERQTSDPEGLVPLEDPLTGTMVPSPGYNPNRFFGIDANTLDADWYHQDGFIMGGDWESAYPLQQKHLAGDCIDLATERQNVKDYINGAIYQYLDMGVDAIRVDTVKHVERDNLLEYVDAWKAHREGLFVFGENLVKGTGWGDLGGDNGPSEIRPWWYTRLGSDPANPNSGGDSGFSVLDFGLFSTLETT